MDPIVTPRLILREMRADDLDFVATMLADPEVMRYWPAPLTRDEAVRWIDRQLERYARDGCGFWLAVDRESGKPVGQAGMLMVDWGAGREPALGYMIHRPFWRRGYATEAARGSCEFVWKVLKEPVVYTLIRPENDASLRIAMKLGMTRCEKIQYYGVEHVVFELVNRRLSAAQ